MHKKLEAELVSLANGILQMKNKDDINVLHKKALDIYEKLTVLRFVENYIDKMPNSSQPKEEIVDTVQNAGVEEIKLESTVSLEIKEEAEEKEAFLEAKMEELFNEGDTIVEETAKKSYSLQISLEDEFKDAISADVATELFERATKENPVIEEKTTEKQENKKRSLNDALFKNNIQVGLNDRIAFVNQLFDGSQQDFNRVVSQLNSFKTQEEAINFIEEFVKPDYDWSNKEEFEQRLINLIERKFL
ncbi:MAG: hypothetical protein PHW92_00265 [Lutibacter sp.]|nr:hypothetical protein [Lutibacter sp.]